MAIRSHFDLHPEDAACISYWGKTGQMVPVSQGGEFVALMNSDLLATMPLPSPLPVADYVVGLELLGFRFAAFENQDGGGSLFYQPPDDAPAGSWEQHANRIHAAYGKGRQREAAEFIKAREVQNEEVSE